MIGGGNWALDRLIPDLVRAFARVDAPAIRSPNAVRPWRHVLEALHGYLMIADQLIADQTAYTDAWNFGLFGRQRGSGVIERGTDADAMARLCAFAGAVDRHRSTRVRPVAAGHVESPSTARLAFGASARRGAGVDRRLAPSPCGRSRRAGADAGVA